MIRSLLAAAVLLFSAAPLIADNAVLADGRQRSQAFFDRDLQSLWNAMTPEMRAGFGTVDALKKFRDDLEAGFGKETDPVEEKTLEHQGFDIYTRTARWTKSPAPVVMQWTFDGEKRIAGFFVRQAPAAAESRFLDYRTKASLRLPFEGEWFVYWGGRTIEQNYHAADRAQRFAIDFVMRRNGVTHSGDASRLDSYFCWDQPILAPADGTVVAVADGLPDQAIGQTDAQNAAGNHVVLDLGEGEFAFLAHLKRGSVAVKVGDKVAPGQELGRCGNSGNTSEPHLHFHLQTTPVLHQGEGLPAFFEDYVADGKPVARGEPVQGQVVTRPNPD
jgi:murein DD-endopeptidase MepM/ murein hydrolase activator NlpD